MSVFSVGMQHGMRRVENIDYSDQEQSFSLIVCSKLVRTWAGATCRAIRWLDSDHDRFLHLSIGLLTEAITAEIWRMTST